PADDRLVVGKRAVAVQLLEVGVDLADVVERVGPLRVARDLRHLPGREARIDVAGELQALLAEPVDLFGDVDRRLVLHVAQLFDLGLELGDRLLEIEEVAFAHREAGGAISKRWAAGRGCAKCTMWPPSGTATTPRPP